MNRGSQSGREAARGEAIGWLLRLDAPGAAEADWLALQAWLEAAPEHLEAYEQAQRVSAELAAAAPELLRALDARRPAARAPAGPRRGFGRRPLTLRRAWPGVAGVAAAAAAAVIAVAVVQPPAPIAPDIYQTVKGESRTLDLADGSHIHLNSGSRIAVRLERGTRNVELAEGEAAFDVAKDASRPFLIAAGDRTIRVVGTEFDVLRHDGRLRVTVRRGVVAVQSPDAAGEPVLLRIGDQLDHQSGEAASTVRRVDPDAAFAWRAGELIYQDRPLDEVVADLNRYFATPVHVSGPAGALRFSGVLKIDAEEDVVRRLQGFLGLAVDRRSDGFTLQLRQASR